MRELNFDFASIKDVIKEFDQNIQLCQQVRTQEGDRDYGLADELRLDCRRVLAYAVAESLSQIAFGGGNSSTSGGYTCYISAEAVSRSEFTESTRIILLDRVYQVQYILGHLDRGILRLHQLKLIPPKESRQVNQAQPDTLFNDYDIS